MAERSRKHNNQTFDEVNPFLLTSDSVALYGSHVRGDADAISDRDILLVSSNARSLFAETAALELRGYSSAAYTWNRLRRMAHSGSLFLQHLKHESVIVKDEECKLETLLNEYSPRVDYSRDIEATKRIIGMLDMVSETKESLGWAYDVLAVSVRNLGILELANRGIYTFSYGQVLSGLAKLGMISATDVETLRELRHFKSLYRSEKYSQVPGIRALQSIHRVVTRRFHIDTDLRVLRPEKLTELLLHKSALHDDKYCRFRLAEGAAIHLVSTYRRLDLPCAHRFFNMVRHQNQYGMYLSDLSKPLHDTAVELANFTWGQQSPPPNFSPTASSEFCEA